MTDIRFGCRRAAILAALALIFASPRAMAAEPNTERLLAGADARIEKHRMADVVISVVDAAGKPVSGAEVTVQQTRHAFLFGSNIFMWGKSPDEQMENAYRKHFSELLNYATLGFYWTGYERRRGEPNHEYAEQVARWCKANNIATKGHPLAWNMGDPAWLPDDAEEIRRLQMARIEDCVSHFPGLIDRWDVVNEATHFDRPNFAESRAPKHTAMWKKVGQIEFTRQCFDHARAAGPKATLLINDYRTDPAYEKVIEQLLDKKDKRQYDVIGIQSHMHGGVWSNEKIWEVCNRYARFGVPLHFTETTILSVDGGWQRGREREMETTPEGEAWQSRETARIYTMLFSHPSVEAITWWDFSDYHAWQAAPAGFLRKDMTPKPMYHELKKLIKGKWWTDATAKTGPDGTAKVRAFLGEYDINVATDGGKSTRSFTLVKGKDNRCEVTLK